MNLSIIAAILVAMWATIVLGLAQIHGELRQANRRLAWLEWFGEPNTPDKSQHKPGGEA